MAQSNTLPPLRYNEEPRQPSTSFHPSNLQNASMLASPRYAEQARFTNFSGISGANNSQMIQSSPMYNRQAPSFSGMSVEQRFESVQPRGNVRFSYERQ